MKKQPQHVVAPTPEQSASLRHRIQPLLIAVAVAAIYYPVFRYPYIQDDWDTLYRIAADGMGKFILGAFTDAGGLFYRPVGHLYCAISTAFTTSDVPLFHAVNLLVLATNAVLVSDIAFRLTGSRRVSWMSAFLFLSAASVHLDPLLWLVGFFDLGGMMFALLSIHAFLRKKSILSVLMLVLALMTKETTVVVPAILVAITLFGPPELTDQKVNGLRRYRSLLPHVGLGLLFLLFRLSAARSALFATDLPYSVSFAGEDLLGNLTRYITWLGQIPFAFSESGWVSGTIVVLVVVGAFLVRGRKSRGTHHAILSVVWVAAAFLPLLFFPHQAYRYYLTAALPGYCMLLALAVQNILAITAGSERVRTGLSIACVIAAIAASWFDVGRQDGQGALLEQRSGSNNLIRKGAVVRMAKEHMLSRYPVLPKGSVIIVDWFPTSAFAYDAGPRLWYHDTTLTVYEARVDSSGIFISKPGIDSVRQANIRLDEQTTYLLKVRNGVMNMMPLVEYFRR